MTVEIIGGIIAVGGLAVALGAALVYQARYKKAINIAEEFDDMNQLLRNELRQHDEGNVSPHAMYKVERIDATGTVYEGYNGFWAVYRVVFNGPKPYKTLIKPFMDEDDDFNKREAEELCDILNDE